MLAFGHFQICKICHSSKYHRDYLNDYLSSYAELLENVCRLAISAARFLVVFDHFQICKICNHFKYGDYLNDYLSNYAELRKNRHQYQWRPKDFVMVYEIFKTLNNLNPVFMKDIFHYSPNVTCKKHNLYIHTQNTTKFGNKSLRAFGANI